MAITYENFSAYPIQILGIDDTYNDELTAIETLVKEKIAYTGEVADIESVLPYFVFYKFCEDRLSEVTAKNGENITTSEFTMPSQNTMIRAFNLGVKKLCAICIEKAQTANIIYLDEISIECGFIL